MFAAAVIKSAPTAMPLENHVWSLIGRHFRLPPGYLAVDA
jgi:hypothetical protein